MCQICLMIDKSIPTPDSLKRTFDEMGNVVDEQHMLEVVDKVIERVEEHNMDSKQFVSELYREFLRNT